MNKRLLGFLLLLGLLALLSPARAEPDFPNLASHANDYAGVLPLEDESRIDNKLALLQQATGRQVVLAVVTDLQGYDIADYGYQLGRHWAIGRKGLNDGAILIVAPKERKVRIEVGYGLEGVLTDGMSSLIIREKIVPRFKEDDMVGGIEAGVDAIIAQLQLPPEEARRLAKEADAAKATDDDSGGGWTGIIVVILFFFVIIWICSRGGKGRRYSSDGSAPVVVWGSSDSSSGWSSSFDSGGSDFSGGGGDFGGGGASGDW